MNKREQQCKIRLALHRSDQRLDLDAAGAKRARLRKSRQAGPRARFHSKRKTRPSWSRVGTLKIPRQLAVDKALATFCKSYHHPAGFEPKPARIGELARFVIQLRESIPPTAANTFGRLTPEITGQW